MHRQVDRMAQAFETGRGIFPMQFRRHPVSVWQFCSYPMKIDEAGERGTGTLALLTQS
jgi:hypothetical protein